MTAVSTSKSHSLQTWCVLTKTNLNTSCSLALIVIGTDQLCLYYTNKMDNLVLLPCHFNGPLEVPAPFLSLIPPEPIHF